VRRRLRNYAPKDDLNPAYCDRVGAVGYWAIHCRCNLARTTDFAIDTGDSIERSIHEGWRGGSVRQLRGQETVGVLPPWGSWWIQCVEATLALRLLAEAE
jgi:hypothetical protein